MRLRSMGSRFGRLSTGGAPRSTSPLLSQLVLGAAVVVAGLGGTACKRSEEAPANSYFDRTIGPILGGSCSKQTTGCHIADLKGNAVGNLDTTSYAMVARRRDLLTTYGPYGSPGLLLKVAGPQQVVVSTLDGNVTVTTDIRHAAGAGVDVTSDGYATLRRWMDNGATENNVGATNKLVAAGACASAIPKDSAFDPKVDPPSFDVFRTKVQPVLKAQCSAGTCHGSPASALNLTCGDTDEQVRWNAYIAAQFITDPPEASELLRRPLDPARGGVFHEGGVVFADNGDPGWLAIKEWATARKAPSAGTVDEGLRYFANRVQPMMVRKGCMFLGCHSPSMFHDLRLAGGSGGQFSLPATRRNYEMSKKMLSIESPDPNVSRLVNKNLLPFDLGAGYKGLRHRGGPLLDDVPGISASATFADCASFDLDKGELDKIPGYCVFARWHQIERKLAVDKGPSKGGVDAEPLRAIVYVSRPKFDDIPQAFDTYRPGARIFVASATLGADGNVTLGASDDKTAGCGLDESTADIRGPAVSWNGTKIAFAARTSAATPLAIYTMNVDGSACAKHKVSDHGASENGILLHDFDPAFAPDGRMVFASTRGAIGQSDLDYKGPTRTPSMLLPNSNLYVYDGDTAPTPVRQLTFLLNAELQPSFMLDGRVISTTEKRAPGFYQLAGRRQNIDGGDYHPLFASRKSIGYDQFTEVAELADRNFIAVFSDRGAVGGLGTIGIFNRSLGPDQFDREAGDRFYLKSLHLPDAAATGKKGAAAAYRSPAPLPASSFLATYAPVDPTVGGELEIVQIHAYTGARRPLLKTAGRSLVEVAAVYARYDHGTFISRVDEPNGAVVVEPGLRDAEVRVLDLPMIASLLFSNTRIGRTVVTEAKALGMLESLPPPNDLTSFAAADKTFSTSDEYGPLWVKRRLLGIQPTFDDASVGLHVPGGMPFVLALHKDTSGLGLIATQKEELQLYPGERARTSFPQRLFNAQCGGCHGSVSGLEVDVHLQPDVLTSASQVAAISGNMASWVYPPDKRGLPTGPPTQ